MRTKLYCLTCIPSGKMYVGITSNLLRKRMASHRHDAFRKETTTPLHRAIRKYGWDNFTVETFFEYPSLEEACEAEQALILSLDLRAVGYNVSPGGETGGGFTGRSHSVETRTRMSMSRKGRPQYVRSPEYRATMSAAKLGKPTGPRSDGVKATMSEARRKWWQRRREDEALFIYS